MPRKPRITAVPVDQAVLTVPVSDSLAHVSNASNSQREGLMVATELPEEKTDAEQMTEIIKEVKEESKEEPREAISDAPVAAKAKAKRASRAKPKEEPVKEEPQEEEPVKEEPILTLKVADQREQEVKEEAKIDDKVACPDCGKQMSAKTLKYSHVANCVTKKQKQKPVFTQGSQDQREENTQPAIQREIEVDFIEQRALNRRAERVARRDAMVNRLMQHAF